METKNEFNWNSLELTAAVVKSSGNFFKADKGKVYLIEIDTTKAIVDRGIVEIAGKPSHKFDLTIIVEGVVMTWSVGKTNLELFDNYIKQNIKKFNIVLGNNGYSVIPILK